MGGDQDGLARFTSRQAHEDILDGRNCRRRAAFSNDGALHLRLQAHRRDLPEQVITRCGLLRRADRVRPGGQYGEVLHRPFRGETIGGRRGRHDCGRGNHRHQPEPDGAEHDDQRCEAQQRCVRYYSACRR